MKLEKINNCRPRPNALIISDTTLGRSTYKTKNKIKSKSTFFYSDSSDQNTLCWQLAGKTN
jgi:hypothetical protein